MYPFVRSGFCFFALLSMSSPSFADAQTWLKPGMVTDWNLASDDGREFHGKGLTWNAHPLEVKRDVKQDVGHAFQLTVRVFGAPNFQQVVTAGGENVQFAYGQFDLALPDPQLIVSTYSGGELCCASRSVIVHRADGWQSLPLPAGAYDTDLVFPKDIDGDGVADFVLSDDRFAYAFDNFADSWRPPRIFALHGGALAEESDSRHFDAFYRQDRAAAAVECVKHKAGACAGYVADSIRLGDFAAGWQFMLDHYCADTRCNDAFPKALAVFLGKNGYLSEAQAQALFFEPRKPIVVAPLAAG